MFCFIFVMSCNFKLVSKSAEVKSVTSHELQKHFEALATCLETMNKAQDPARSSVQQGTEDHKALSSALSPLDVNSHNYLCMGIGGLTYICNNYYRIKKLNNNLASREVKLQPMALYLLGIRLGQGPLEILGSF